MQATPPDGGEARLRSLERRLTVLERRAGRRHARRRAPDAREARRRAAWLEARSEQWLGRAGVGLLSLGLVYLFQYSIEQGWLTPGVRVAVGVAIGSLLLWLGLRLAPERRSFSQLLLAGAVAAYYASGWAAFQLYALVGHVAAMLFMTGVMGLALTLSLRRGQPALASLGAAGGLATPLLLRGEAVPVLELAVYASLVVAWAGAVFALRGWRSLVWTYGLGSLLALALAAGHAAAAERPVVLAAILLAWAGAGALPFARGRFEAERPRRRVLLGLLSHSLQLRLLGVGASTAALFLVDRLWALRDPQTGTLFLALAVAYAAFAWIGTGRERFRLHARAAAPVAGALAATGIYLIVSEPATLVLALSALAAGCVLAGGRERFAGTEWVGHTLFALLALELVRDAVANRWVFGDPLALAQAVQIGLLFAASWQLRSEPVRRLYRLGAHALVLGWLGKELSPVSEGRAVVTVAWGAYGALLLVLALHWRDRREAITTGLQVVALSALALAVGKLLAVDLVRMALVWRIALFMGFGAGLLALSARVRPGTLPPGTG
jgi:uncharacterized membrane protein